jgi:hypothetical protein
MNKFILTIGLLLVTACSGGTPTGPTTVPTPTPVPPVVVPAPEPTPEPVPEPAPAPVPSPVPTAKWTGAVETEHWFGAAQLSGHFDISFRYNDLQFDRLAATILIQDTRSVFAKTADGASIQIVFSGPTYGSWTYNGLKGQASGTLEFK